jgi:hypothetical protein
MVLAHTSADSVAATFRTLRVFISNPDNSKDRGYPLVSPPKTHYVISDLRSTEIECLTVSSFNNTCADYRIQSATEKISSTENEKDGHFWFVNSPMIELAPVPEHWISEVIFGFARRKMSQTAGLCRLNQINDL